MENIRIINYRKTVNVLTYLCKITNWIFGYFLTIKGKSEREKGGKAHDIRICNLNHCNQLLMDDIDFIPHIFFCGLAN